MSDNLGSTLYEVADALLDLTVATFADSGLSLPSRQVVYLSPIPADCEQVAVLLSDYSADPPQDGMVNCIQYQWVGNFTVLVTRCTPAVSVQKGKSVGPPSETEMRAAAEAGSKDAEALLQVVQAVGLHGGEVSIMCEPPAGGLQSTVLTLRVPVG